MIAITIIIITLTTVIAIAIIIVVLRLFQRVSCESGYNSASPTLGLTGNMQLSNRWKCDLDEYIQQSKMIMMLQQYAICSSAMGGSIIVEKME